jgi:H+/gluconate symporter-like permease
MEVLGIILSLALLMFFAYRGFTVILFAPVFALLAAALSGLPLLPTYTELFMPNAVGYVKLYFPVFMLGAVFGKVMEETGLAKSIAHFLVEKLGKERGILSIVLSCIILTYGGVSLFVVVFAVYPFAAALFKEAGIPKRLVPGAIALGSFTATMDSFPGSPQIQNVIPTTFFGTTTWAAPVTGFIGGILILGLGYLYLNSRVKAAIANGEGYGDHTLNEPKDAVDTNNLPSFWIALAPLVTVLALNYILSQKVQWDPAILAAYKGVSIASVKGIWALIISLIAGICLAVGFGWQRLGNTANLAKALNAGAIGSLLAIMNTASEVGYGNVIKTLSGFNYIRDALLAIKVGGTPLVSEAVAVNVLAGITGSASGGMSIALGVMGKTYLEWANAVGLNPEMLHRVAAMASGGMDTLPHNGAVITLLAVCGLTHRDSYKDIFAITCIKTATVFAVILIHTVTGLV